MKKTILIIGLCSIGLINAEDISSDTVAQFIADVQGKSFEKSPQIIKGWVDFKSMMLNMAADELAKKTDKEPSLGQVVETMRTLSKQLKELPVPKEGMTKELEEPAKWLEVKADESELKSIELNEMAKQLNSAAAGTLAKHFSGMAKAIRGGIESASANKADVEMATESARAGA